MLLQAGNDFRLLGMRWFKRFGYIPAVFENLERM